MRIERRLRKGDKQLTLVITDHGRGWKVRHEEGVNSAFDVVHDDWHRAERDLMLFDLRAAALRQEGWN